MFPEVAGTNLVPTARSIQIPLNANRFVTRLSLVWDWY